MPSRYELTALARVVDEWIGDDSGIDPAAARDIRATLAPMLRRVPTADEIEAATWHLLIYIEGRTHDRSSRQISYTIRFVRMLQSARRFGISTEAPGGPVEPDPDGVIRPRGVAGSLGDR